MNDLTQGKEANVIIRFAVPMLLGNVFQQLYNVVDSIIVGNYLGKEALSAVGASFPITFVLMSVVIGIATGGTILIGQYFGAKKYEEVKKTIDTINILLFFASLLIGAIGIFFSEAIFRLIDMPEEIIPDASLYLKITLGGVITAFGFNGISAILRGLGDSKTPLYFLIVSTVVNIILDLLFVIEFGWGIAGVAIATVLAQGGSFLSAVIYLNRTHDLIRIGFTQLNFDMAIFKKSIQIGLPSGLQMLFVSLGMTALYGIVNQFGTDVIAAYSAAMRIDSFAIMPAMNFAMALGPFVSQNLGANKIERVSGGLLATWWMSSLVSVFFSVAVYFFGDNLMQMFSPDENVIRIGHDYLVITGSFYLLFSTMFVVNAVFRGAGDTLVPMFITLVALWVVRVPVSYWLSGMMGESGIWWGVPIGWGFGLVWSLIYYRTGRWRRKVVVKAVSPEGAS